MIYSTVPIAGMLDQMSKTELRRRSRCKGSKRSTFDRLLVVRNLDNHELERGIVALSFPVVAEGGTWLSLLIAECKRRGLPLARVH